MGQLAFVGSHSINGVSALHTELMKETVFADLHRLYPDRINNKTNGITPRRWLMQCNPGLTKLIQERIGPEFLDNTEALSDLDAHAEDPGFQSQFAAVKHANKERLAEIIRERVGTVVSPEAMFDVHIKRIHEYKRQLLNIIETVALYDAIRAHPEKDWVPRVKIFAGKAAPSYWNAKLIIKLINDVARVINHDPAVRGLSEGGVPAQLQRVPGGDRSFPRPTFSEQISTAGMEASGTGNMKLALNGAITIGTLDGANVEIRDCVGPDNIVIFGLTADQVLEQRASATSPRSAIEESPRSEGGARCDRHRRVLARRSRPLSRSHRRALDMTISWWRATSALITPRSARSTGCGATEDLAGDGDQEHRACRLVFLRPDDPAICRGHLGRPGERVEAIGRDGLAGRRADGPGDRSGHVWRPVRGAGPA